MTVNVFWLIGCAYSLNNLCCSSSISTADAVCGTIWPGQLWLVVNTVDVHMHITTHICTSLSAVLVQLKMSSIRARPCCAICSVEEHKPNVQLSKCSKHHELRCKACRRADLHIMPCNSPSESSSSSSSTPSQPFTDNTTYQIDRILKVHTVNGGKHT